MVLHVAVRTKSNAHVTQERLARALLNMSPAHASLLAGLVFAILRLANVAGEGSRATLRPLTLNIQCGYIISFLGRLSGMNFWKWMSMMRARLTNLKS